MPDALERVTIDRLKSLCPRADGGILEAIITDAPSAFPAAGLTSAVGIAHFLAQIATEAAGLSRLDENLRYTTAEVLQRTFKSKFPTVADARPFLRAPEKLANFVYGDRNGNKGGSDGWDYRGSGLIQLTGRGNYRTVGNLVGLSLEAQPELARQPDSALAIALGYWAKRNINDVADDATEAAVEKVTRLISPALHGIKDRKAYFKRALVLLTPPKVVALRPSARKSPFGLTAGVAAGAELSGPAWVERFPTSRSVADLAPPFRDHVHGFVAALEAGRATVRISATYRPRERAYLMHWAWLIAKGQVDPATVPAMDGVDIEWVHSTPAKSRAAARAMVAAYGMVQIAALNSRHIERRAIDMTIGWTGSVRIARADGSVVDISSQPRNGSNPSLIAIGRSWGVIKLPTDPPHWSDDGR